MQGLIKTLISTAIFQRISSSELSLSCQKRLKIGLPFLLGTRKTNQTPLIHPSKCFWPPSPSCQALNLANPGMEESRDWQNLFAVPRFRYTSRFFLIYFTINGVKKFVRNSGYMPRTSLYRGSPVISRFHCTHFY